MHVKDATLRRQCDANWNEMTPAGDHARSCANCATLVHDLSTMSLEAARATLASEGVCVRYLYDRDGKLVFGAPPGDAVIVPAAALVSKRSRRQWLAIASVVALPVLLEACGPGDAPITKTQDAGGEDSDDQDEDGRAFERADAGVEDRDAR